MTETHSRYVEWLGATGAPLYEGGGMTWRRYQGALVPADPTLTFINVDRTAVAHLPRSAGALFVRWSTDPKREPTEWWHVVCTHYDLADLPSDMRNKVRRGLRAVEVRRVDTSWLADHGYPCYVAAFGRYRGGRPMPESAFRAAFSVEEDAPFESWAAFRDGELAGYAQMIVEEDRVALNTSKFTPAALKDRAFYAVLGVLLEEYVGRRGMEMSNGARAIHHLTEMQDFLLQFGFERSYGRLAILYSPLGRLAASAARLTAPAARILPGTLKAKVRGLAFQEKVRRACASRP